MTTSLLIVDDEPSVLETTRFILEARGYEVHVARNGDQALVAARLHHPLVMLLDVMMPHKDGFTICREIRQDPQLAATYVIMLTARGLPVDEARALDAGADVYLRKPFDEEQVVEIIKAAEAARRRR